MNFSSKYALCTLAAFLAIVPAAHAQQANLNIGYVYPAGGKQGTTFEAVIAGQFLAGVDQVHVSGGGVQVKITEIIRPISGKELNELRIRIDELLARKAVVRNDFAALEKFRSFKKAKDVKKDDAKDDDELKELKAKYAGATWTAADEKELAEVRKKMSSGVRRPANPAISELVVVQVTVDADAPSGTRELRIATPNGLSNPLAFCVSQLPEVAEEASKNISEQRSAVAKTAFAPKGGKREPEQEITLPAVVNGQILPSEVDRFRFTARQGQRLVATVSARELIPYIADAVPGWFQATLAIYDAQGKELAYNDDFRFHPDPVLCCEIPADGQYVVEIKDAIYRGREDFVYRITIGELPFVTGVFPLGAPAGVPTTVELTGWNLPMAELSIKENEQGPAVRPICARGEDWVSNVVPFAVDTLPECREKEPNHEPSQAQPVVLPIVVNGRIDRAGQPDVFRFEGKAGDEVVAEVLARRLNSPLDSILRLTDATGKELASNDDQPDKSAGLTTHHADSYLRFALPADGTYFVHLDDMQRRGGPEYAYRLRIGAPRPDFELRVVPSSITVRGGATFPITVYALRKDGFNGEILLAAKDAPKGVSLSGARVPPGQDQVRLTLTLPPLEESEPLTLSLEGRATVEGRQVVRPVVPADDRTQAFEYRHLVPAKELTILSAGRLSKTVAKIVGEGPLKIPAGGSAQVKFAVPSSKAMGKLQLQLNDPPEGIVLRKTTPTDEGVAIVFESDAAKVKPGLQGNLIVGVGFSGGKTSSSKGKQSGQRRGPVATLPAIPFEIVAP